MVKRGAKAPSLCSASDRRPQSHFITSPCLFWKERGRKRRRPVQYHQRRRGLNAEVPPLGEQLDVSQLRVAERSGAGRPSSPIVSSGSSHPPWFFNPPVNVRPFSAHFHVALSLVFRTTRCPSRGLPLASTPPRQSLIQRHQRAQGLVDGP